MFLAPLAWYAGSVAFDVITDMLMNPQADLKYCLLSSMSLNAIPGGGIINKAKKAQKVCKHSSQAFRTVKVSDRARKAISKGAIRKVDVAKLFKNCKEHIFSKNHIKDSIKKLGKNEREIFDSGLNIVRELDKKGMLKEGSTQIKTMINGLEAEVRIYIKNGELKRMNMFQGHSGRHMGNTINYKK